MKVSKSFFYIGLDDHAVSWKEIGKLRKDFKSSDIYARCNPSKRYKTERGAETACKKLNAEQDAFKLVVIECFGVGL